MIEFLKKFGRKEKNKTTICTAVVPAAGNASRMEGLDKILVELDGIPILVHSLRTLDACPYIHEIIIVTREDLMVPIGKMCREFSIEKVTKVLVGGKTRSESVLNGLRETREDADLVAIHDGARPFLSSELLEDLIHTGRRTAAAAPAVPVTDTIKEAADGLVKKTLEREQLFAIQTPQVFEINLIRGALEEAIKEKIPLTDDCSAVERLGMKVTLCKGAYQNIKITTPLDMSLAQGILIQKKEGTS